MQWLKKVVDEVLAAHPEGGITVSSGVSPSGKYHVGTLREVLTADAILIALKNRGRPAKHIHVVDDLDVLRKIPAGIPADYEKYLGKSLCDVPSPVGEGSYADYYFEDFHRNMAKLGIDAEVMRGHLKYREGYFVPAIEKALKKSSEVRQILETVSGHKLGEEWSPVQINEGGYLKKRKFLGIDTKTKTIDYQDLDGQQQTIAYDKGDVKLDWRIDWPARWWLLGVDVEPFGRDHATKGGSYDTGADICRKVFASQPPIPVPYQFINRAGETKKMSKSAGDTVTISELLEILPPEVIRFFVLRYSPEKTLFFDQGDGVVRLIDEYEKFVSKTDKTEEEQLLLEVCKTSDEENISKVPFSHLVASYQASLKDPGKTIELLKRNSTAKIDGSQEKAIRAQLSFVDNWLKKWAPEDVKFQLAEKAEPADFTDKEKDFLVKMAAKIENAPAGADGEYFHKAIYDFQNELGIEPKDLFQTLYKVLIGKTSGPRAGWFLSILPREWLIKRLRFEA